MNRNNDDAWDPYLDDEPESVDRAEWDEEDWEQFLLRQDALNAKYQELYETLRDHPERDEIIAREMRWQLPEDLYGDAPDAPGGLADDDGWLEREQAFVTDLDAIPAFRTGEDFALRVDRLLTARLRQRIPGDADGARAVRTAVDAADHVASGHSIGYERDTLCGNIACCKRALRSIADSCEALIVLRQRGALTPPEADALLDAGRQASDAIALRIDELRRRVWWC